MGGGKRSRDLVRTWYVLVGAWCSLPGTHLVRTWYVVVPGTHLVRTWYAGRSGRGVACFVPGADLVRDRAGN